ncbi:unnamed protein product [Rhizoctonia solani]|uniref:Caspase family p20 domain-containing protein n=1 Tax=Rhizoctonia solani TaxID=456999 RepID=A0A8H3HAX3_9AGAM|nr:unnamed protein product [Rhizoctonia solani]
MSPSLPNAPVAKGRKSRSMTQWYNLLPTDPSLDVEQEISPKRGAEIDTRPVDSVSRGVAAQVVSTTVRPPNNFLHPRAAQIYTPRPEAPSSILQLPPSRPQTPLSRPHTPLNQRPALPNRPLTPSSRPQTPSFGKQRPPNINVSPNRIRKGVVAYNPEATEGFDISSPMAHGLRDAPAHVSSNPHVPPTHFKSLTTSSGPTNRGPHSPSRSTTYQSIDKCERGLLIIGSSHREPTPYADELPPLHGIRNDRDRLRTAFQNRKYSVETMVEEEGDKREILRRVGNFLASADEGNIRVIVFTGHAARIGTDQRFAIIPSGCASDDDTITAAEWQDIVLKNAGAGVVVVSVFATCMSGAVAEQSVKLTDFGHIIERQSSIPNLPNGPIQIILSSSGDNQSSFEYHTPSGYSGSSWHDYFLWALAETTQRKDVNNWESFVKTLQAAFNYVRAASFRNSSFQYPHDLNWLLLNPQTPRIFVSSRMPDFDQFLPRQNY